MARQRSHSADEFKREQGVNLRTDKLALHAPSSDPSLRCIRIETQP